MRMRCVPRIQDEEPPGALANPLDEPLVTGALVKGLDAVERIVDAAAVCRRLRPFVNHRRGKFEVAGNFLRRFLIKYFAEQFVRFHGATMRKSMLVGKHQNPSSSTPRLDGGGGSRLGRERTEGMKRFQNSS